MNAQQFEEEHVHHIYTKIAADFSHTRSYVWNGVKEFINSLPTSSKVLDAGCGNGKNMFRQDLEFIGIDPCPEFVQIASQYGQTSIGNILDLQFDDNSFDAVICVAVLHHLSTKERRIQALKELARVLKPNGQLFIQVWAKENNTKKRIIEYNKVTHDCFIPWQFTTKFASSNRECVHRYYHLSTKDELASNVENIGLTIKQHFNEKENWVVIAKK